MTIWSTNSIECWWHRRLLLFQTYLLHLNTLEDIVKKQCEYGPTHHKYQITGQNFQICKWYTWNCASQKHPVCMTIQRSAAVVAATLRPLWCQPLLCHEAKATVKKWSKLGMNFLSAAASRSPRLQQKNHSRRKRFCIDQCFHWVWPSPTGGGQLTVFIKLPVHGEEHACIMHYCITFAVWVTKGLQ